MVHLRREKAGAGGRGQKIREALLQIFFFLARLLVELRALSLLSKVLFHNANPLCIGYFLDKISLFYAWAGLDFDSPICASLMLLG
jgi:hypothetical protein